MCKEFSPGQKIPKWGPAQKRENRGGASSHVRRETRYIICTYVVRNKEREWSDDKMCNGNSSMATDSFLRVRTHNSHWRGEHVSIPPGMCLLMHDAGERERLFAFCRKSCNFVRSCVSWLERRRRAKNWFRKKVRGVFAVKIEEEEEEEEEAFSGTKIISVSLLLLLLLRVPHLKTDDDGGGELRHV